MTPAGSAAMVDDVDRSLFSTATEPASLAHRPRQLVLACLLAGGGFVGWIIVLAIRLPARYRADHWNVAWAGFDVMLLISLVTSAWVLARLPRVVPTAFIVTAVLLACDAWFDVTTASGTADTAVSLVCAGAVELPLAGTLVWVARRRIRADLPAPYRQNPPSQVGMAGSPDSRWQVAELGAVCEDKNRHRRDGE
jgi:hypothetical protein